MLLLCFSMAMIIISIINQDFQRKTLVIKKTNVREGWAGVNFSFPEHNSATMSIHIFTSFLIICT